MRPPKRETEGVRRGEEKGRGGEREGRRKGGERELVKLEGNYIIIFLVVKLTQLHEN